MQILEKQEPHDLIFKIFHIEFEDFKNKFSKENDGTVASTCVTMVPTLFGIKLTSFKMEFNFLFYPPQSFVCLTLSKFNITSKMVSSMVPIAPMKLLVVNHFYHGNDFISKLVERIAFSAVRQFV